MPAGTLNFSNTTPAAPSGQQNVTWQNDGGSPTVNVSAYVPLAVAAANFVEEVVTFSGTSGTLAHTPNVLLGIYRNGIRMTSLAGSPAIQTFSITGAAVTLSVAAGGSDVFIAVYFK